MKLCKDCKWRDGHQCVAPQNSSGIDPVNGGKAAGRIVTCEAQRTGSFTGWFLCRVTGLCGKEGRWFTPNDRLHGREGSEV